MRKVFDIHAPVFYPSALITIAFVCFTLFFPAIAETYFGMLQSFMTKQFGWLISFGINYYLLFVLFLAGSKLGKIRIGGPHVQPEFSRVSWIAMLFSAGMGIGLVYFSVAEPLYHFVNPVDSDMAELLKAKEAMKYTFFHYGFHVWGIYCLLGIALAFFCFNQGLPLSLRSTFYPLIGDRIHGPIGNIIDNLAILSTLFGLATSLGFGAIQFSSGLSRLVGLSNGIELQVGAIVVITSIATLSILSGLNKGLKYLSNLNMFIALVLLLFMLSIGSGSELLDSYLENMGIYLQDFIKTSTFRGTYAGSADWFIGWSMFYWTWWISWSPFVGTFIARISKGRTIREIVLYGLLAPSLFSFLWMSTFGGIALGMEMEGQANLAIAVSTDSSTALFVMLEQLPLSTITSFLSIFLVATFFITSSDSGSLVVDYMAAGGKLDTTKGQKIFWASLEGLIAIALLVGGGLAALQSVAITTGFPFALVLFVISYSLLKALQKHN